MTVRIGLGDAEDPRVLAAAERLVATGTVVPVLVGAVDTVPAGAELVACDRGASIDRLALLVKERDVVAGIGGSLTTSPLVLRAAIHHLRTDGLISGCFALAHPSGWTTYADCVVVPQPDAEQLARIAADAADHHRRVFDVVPRVAMLSFSTAGSATHPRVSFVQDATARLRAARPDLLVDGEVQFDVAVDADVAARKVPGSAVAGGANVLVFPSLEAANIAYKVAERIGGVRALGSFVLGTDYEWVDLSRGCSVADIVETAALLARTAPRHAAA